MNIIDLKYQPYKLRLLTTFETSKSTISERKGFIISLKSSSGKVGIGDVSPFPEFGSETYEQAQNQIDSLRMELKIEKENIQESLKTILKEFNTSPSLRHGLEQALINLVCNEYETSVSQLLNIKLKRKINVNAVIGFLEPEKATSYAFKFVEDGFKTIKVKTGQNNFDDDFKTLASIREAVGEEINIRIDINGKWSLNEAEKYLNQLEKLSIEYAEQPVNSMQDFLELKQRTSIPLAADESIRNLGSAEGFISSSAIDYVILKPMMLGGLNPTLEIIELAEKNNITPVVTSSFESSIGRANAVIAASACKSETAHGLAVSHYFEKDLDIEKYPVGNGCIEIF